jgi:hypothetical protein
MSAFVRRTPATGVLRGESRRGCRRGILSICRFKSGDALMRNHRWKPSESLLMAMLDCVCGVIFPVRAAAQFAQAQFHCGRPPPAALPRIWMRINPEFSESDNYVRSNRACVTGALEKDRNGFQHRFDPLLFGSSHKSPTNFHVSLHSTEMVERGSRLS